MTRLSNQFEPSVVFDRSEFEGPKFDYIIFFTDDTLSTPIQSTSTSIAEDITMTQSDVNTRCPYTGKDMINPVKNKHCGHHYDKEGITHYIKIKGKKAK